ncbi:MAG: AbrB/MazE/SpoVT family DNA-binding domain-containing protein [Longimicrobiales bacterium]
MRVRVQKWGNSLAVRIPRPIAADAGLQEGNEADMVLSDGEIHLRPVSPRYELADLIRAIKPTNRHGEVDWGSRRGGEVW